MMAVDDVTVVLSIDIAAGSSVTRQPSSGVEEVLLHGGGVGDSGGVPDGTPDCDFESYDGTDSAIVYDDGQSALWMRWRFVIDNTNYLRQINRNGSTGDMSFSVIQIG